VEDIEAVKAGPDVLQTERLLLRPWEQRDAPALAELLDNIEFYSGTVNIPFPYGIEDALEFIGGRQRLYEEDRSAAWAVTLEAEDRLVGGISLELDLPGCKAEMGYWTGIPWWNTGVCSEAAQAVLDYAFDRLGLNLVEARHFTRNEASGRVMLRIGMRREAVLRQRACKDGEFLDMAVCSITAEEHRRGNGRA
jgi:RimJ/RimL family protein N-acetyltransferase